MPSAASCVARVIGIAGGPEKVALGRRLGAEHMFDHRAAESGAFAPWVKEVTDGHGADVILDVVGAPYLAPNVSALAPEGRIVTLAVQGGAVPEDFNIMKLVVKRGWLTGATLRSRSVVDKAGIVAAAERAVWPLVAAGRIDASVGACFPLAEAAEAFDWFDSATRTGKVVLVTDPADARRPSGDRA